MVTHVATINTTFCHVVILHHLKYLSKVPQQLKEMQKTCKQILLLVKIKGIIFFSLCSFMKVLLKLTFKLK